MEANATRLDCFQLELFSGGEAPFYMIGYFFLSGVILRALSPPFGKCN